MPKQVHVAAGVIRDQGKVLLAKRPDHVHQGGLWEFPGGKVEPGESAGDALRRELREELAIEVSMASPLIQVRHHYPDKSVLLDVWEVNGFTGTPVGNEGQPLAWVDPKILSSQADAPYLLPTANTPIVRVLQLPPVMIVVGDFVSPGDFQQRLSSSLSRQSGLIYLRTVPDHFSVQDLLSLVENGLDICQLFASPLLISSRLFVLAPDFFYRKMSEGSLGIQIAAKDLPNFTDHFALPGNCLTGASCHNNNELQMAETAGVDFAVLSPVNATASHPGAAPLGWQQFTQLAELFNQPIYALGGIGPGDLSTVRQNGGQGVAGISRFWH